MELGIIFGLASMLSWGFADFLNKVILQKITLKQMLYIGIPMNLLFLILMWPIFVKDMPGIFDIGFALLTAVIMSTAWTCFMIAMSKEKLSLVTAVGSAYPMITIALGVFILGEKILPKEYLGILLVIIGLIFACISFKDKLKITSGLKFAIAAFLIWGVGFFLLKISVDKVGWYLATFASFFIQFIFLWVFWVRKEKISEAKKSLGLTIIWSILGVSGFLAYSIGTTLERVSIVTPISAMFPAVAIAFGFVFLKERLEQTQWLGIAMVIIGGVVLSI